MGTTLMVSLIASSAAGIGTSIYSLTNQPKPPTMPADNTQEQAQAAQAAAQAQATNLMNRRGMASTMLQSPFGGAAPSTQRATLGT